MGVEEKLDFKKDSTLGLSPNTVLPSHRHSSNVHMRNAKAKPPRKDVLSLKEDFREISFGRYRSSSCKSVPYKPVGLEDKVELRRGSIYQSSQEVRNMKKMSFCEGRRKIEMSDSSDTSFSFEIVDSLCGSDVEMQQKRSSVTPLSSNVTSISKPYEETCSPSGFFEICPNTDNRSKCDSAVLKRQTNEELKLKCDKVISPLNDGNGTLEKDAVRPFHKSLSAKVGMPQSPSPSASDHTSRDGSKARFIPIRKMFDPFMKSKSLRSPLGYVVEPIEVNSTGTENTGRNRTLQKSLLHDFSNTAQKPEVNYQFLNNDNKQSIVVCSPIHLHGSLKLKKQNGAPIYEFSLKCPEDVIVAKTWKADNTCNWVYTFHSIESRKRSNASGRGSNDGNKESSMVGQMQVSCYLCSELRDGGAIDNSMVSEFALYDIGHARKSVADQENPNCLVDVGKPPKRSGVGLVGGTPQLGNKSDPAKVNVQPKHGLESGDFDSSTLYPWPSRDLHSDLEIAAIVIQVPFQKRESLKYKRGDSISDKVHRNLLNLSLVEPKRKKLSDNASTAKVNVIIPAGHHGLPCTESHGPSSLLDRWRLGGGCDCGGWDMACPLIVFDGPSLQCDDQLLVEKHEPFELFVQGSKENTSALTLTFVEEGEFAVDFHAQLSTLQAFSICLAILHTADASSSAGQERNKQLSYCGSLNVLIEDEVKFLIEAVTEEKGKLTKKRKEIPPSYLIKPPFSPISRV